MGARPDLTYATVDGHDLALDLFLPAAQPTPVPAVVLVHGGGWHAGARQQFAWHAADLASRGYVAASVSYRLLDVAGFPACFDDCQTAVAWLQTHAPELNLDPTRIGAVGSSAGGHLAALLGARAPQVQCVVDYHGIHDFTTLPDDKLADVLDTLFAGPRATTEPLRRDASPALWVDARSAPMLLFHDPDDPTVPYDQSVQLATALLQAHRPVSLIPVPGASHGFCYDPQNGWLQRTWPLAVQWLAWHLGR